MGQKLKAAITFFAQKLRNWYRLLENDDSIPDEDINLRMAATFYGRDKLIQEFDAEMKSIEEDCLRDVEMQESEEALMEHDRGVSHIDFEKLFTLKHFDRSCTRTKSPPNKSFFFRITIA